MLPGRTMSTSGSLAGVLGHHRHRFPYPSTPMLRSLPLLQLPVHAASSVVNHFWPA